MAEYTVKHRETGRVVTFTWDKETPPTGEDIRNEFQKDIQNELARRRGGNWMPSSYEGIPKWGLQNPNLWALRGAGLEVYDKMLQPSLEAGGAILGATYGTPALGGALGYAGGKKIGEMGYGYLSNLGMPPELKARKRGVLEETMRSAKDVGGAMVLGKAFEGATRVATAIDEQVSSVIRHGIEKGIRPTVVGKRTFPQMEKYYHKAEQGVKSIIENKQNLNLTNEYGEPVEGLPKNLRQFSQAIDNTKRVIFDRYNVLQKAAGTKGATISLQPAVKELRAFANQKAVQLTNPGSISYARDLIKRFTVKKGTILTIEKVTPAEAQEMIARLNNSLEAFYKNPSYHTANKAYIDSLVVNNLRKGLDEAILKTTGKQYQVLKNQYGSLKAIEREVNHRAVVDARKNIKGLIDFSDVFTGYHAARGILSMDPATMGAAATGKFVAWLYRIRNQPNFAVKTMFNKAEKLMMKPGYTGVIGAPRTTPQKTTIRESLEAYKEGLKYF